MNTRDGVVMLWRKTGAYHELTDCMISVNPFDIEERPTRSPCADDGPGGSATLGRAPERRSSTSATPATGSTIRGSSEIEGGRDGRSSRRRESRYRSGTPWLSRERTPIPLDAVPRGPPRSARRRAGRGRRRDGRRRSLGGRVPGRSRDGRSERDRAEEDALGASRDIGGVGLGAVDDLPGSHARASGRDGEPAASDERR